MKIVVSACLLGENCKYNGGNNYSASIAKYLEGKEVILVCPEVLAGLGVPRTPIEIVDGVVFDRNGNCVDAALRQAVQQIVTQLEGQDISYVILKSRSPTCGVHQVYDGTFSGKLVDGMGILAQALKEKGYCVVDSEDCNFNLPGFMI